MKIKNFKHDSNIGTIEFEVEHNGEVNKVKLESTGHGTRYTDIDDFTEYWTDGEYDQLEGFIEGCSGILHQFYHS
ncbi:hypothetical protein CIW83_09525 [Tissierella sp. P1]|uniref:hypothetical protein n=1 Tax=Tissierella sp. P1 TaxID=1280483 RepID=UPI000BA075F9|nr:hypothetical protein [Tissierella sp. P1]OZV12326.1 hypothetical protein CIW83_09525 [Tissierella sp. P1]